MAGRRTSLASLAGQKVEDVPGRSDPTLVRLALATVAPTPLNRRSNFGTPEELAELGESMRRRQLQPIVVVSRASYLKLFAEHADQIGTATYIIVNGERRYRAATAVDLGSIEAVIREEVAISRKDFLDAVLSENIDRKNLDPIEEAHAVEALVQEFGSARAVAEHRGKHEAWVSQRRSLLRLSPAMQDLVRNRAMPVEKARKLAKAVKDHGLNDQQQADWWKAEQEQPKETHKAEEQQPTAETRGGEDFTAVKSAPPSGGASTPAPEGSTGQPPGSDDSGPENFTAVKSPMPSDETSQVRGAGAGSRQPSSEQLDVPGLPWDSPTALDRLLRRHMTPENRLTLAKLLSVES